MKLMSNTEKAIKNNESAEGIFLSLNKDYKNPLLSLFRKKIDNTLGFSLSKFDDIDSFCDYLEKNDGRVSGLVKAMNSIPGEDGKIIANAVSIILLKMQKKAGTKKIGKK